MIESVLHVNGASLYYKTIGAGPLLVLIPVGNATTLIYEPLASYLSSHFRVLLYDRRGYYRSPAERIPATDEIFQVHADDLAALIEHISSSSPGNGRAPEPAFILAPSGSMGIAFGLLTTRPHLVNKVVLHEPITVAILPGPLYTHYQEKASQILGKSLKDDITGATALITPFLHTKAEIGLYRKTSVCRQVTARIPPQQQGRWLKTELTAIKDYEPDLEKLQRSPYREKLILVCGMDETTTLARLPGLCLGEALMIPINLAPGSHLGYVTHAREFAECLGNLLVGRDGARL